MAHQAPRLFGGLSANRGRRRPRGGPRQATQVQAMACHGSRGVSPHAPWHLGV